MRRRLLVAVSLVGLLSTSMASAQEASFCFALSDFVDTLELTLIAPAPGAGNFTLRAQQTTPVYQLIGMGAAVPSIDPTWTWQVGLHLANPTGFFDGNPSCTVNIFLLANFFGGIAIDCVGVNPPFLVPPDRVTEPLGPLGFLGAGSCSDFATTALMDDPRPLAGAPR